MQQAAWQSVPSATGAEWVQQAARQSVPSATGAEWVQQDATWYCVPSVAAGGGMCATGCMVVECTEWRVGAACGLHGGKVCRGGGAAQTEKPVVITATQVVFLPESGAVEPKSGDEVVG